MDASNVFNLIKILVLSFFFLFAHRHYNTYRFVLFILNYRFLPVLFPVLFKIKRFQAC